jgi:hypothetical protein
MLLSKPDTSPQADVRSAEVYVSRTKVFPFSEILPRLCTDEQQAIQTVPYSAFHISAEKFCRQ